MRNVFSFVGAFALLGAFLVPRGFAEPIDTQPTAVSQKACFNFRRVVTFRTQAPSVIRIELEDKRTFDLRLEGPGCDALEPRQELAIRSAPVIELCTGSVSGSWSLQLAAKGKDLKCRLRQISLPPPEPAPKKDEPRTKRIRK